MYPVLAAVLILLTSISLVLGLDKGSALVSSQILSKNIPNNNLITDVSASEIPPVKVLQDAGIPAPTTSATSIIIKDLDTNKILYSKNENQRVAIASTTKIMTALVASSYFQPNDVLEVKDISMAGGSTMGLHSGEKLTFRSLLYGMLLNSGNDAAFTLAQDYPGGIDSFILEMNQKAKDLNLQNTHFDNPAGFDSPNHYSSAADLSVIAQAATTNDELLRVVGTKESIVSSVDKTTIHNLKNVNQLLGVDGVIGFKTGYTPAAKENLVGLVKRDNQHELLTVVLGSDDRFGETEKLIDWAYANFSWH